MYWALCLGLGLPGSIPSPGKNFVFRNTLVNFGSRLQTMEALPHRVTIFLGLTGVDSVGQLTGYERVHPPQMFSADYQNRSLRGILFSTVDNPSELSSVIGGIRVLATKILGKISVARTRTLGPGEEPLLSSG